MFALLRMILRVPIWPTLVLVAATSVTVEQASASLIWNWNYSGTGIVASGTFTSTETPDASGFYQITGITGTRNGETITVLQPTGSAIPGNEPFAVDNLARLNGPQLTHNGFGYATADGNYANPFFADFLSPARYLEFYSAPPFTGGAGPEDSELPITFFATPITVPEPETYALLLIGLGVLTRLRFRERCV
jgi:PEP-CTERM motif